MKRLGEFIFDDSSSEEEDDDDFKRAMCVMLKDEIHSSILVSQFGHLYINRGRSKGHAKFMRDCNRETLNNPPLLDPHPTPASSSCHRQRARPGSALSLPVAVGPARPFAWRIGAGKLLHGFGCGALAGHHGVVATQRAAA
jgi:hypothetical protein